MKKIILQQERLSHFKKPDCLKVQLPGESKEKSTTTVPKSIFHTNQQIPSQQRTAFFLNVYKKTCPSNELKREISHWFANRNSNVNALVKVNNEIDLLKKLPTLLDIFQKSKDQSYSNSSQKSRIYFIE